MYVQSLAIPLFLFDYLISKTINKVTKGVFKGLVEMIHVGSGHLKCFTIFVIGINFSGITYHSFLMRVYAI